MAASAGPVNVTDAGTQPRTVNANDAGALFTATSLLTFQGSTVALSIVSGVLAGLVGNSKWVEVIIFVLAMGLSFLGAWQARGTGQDITTSVVVAFFNGILIYAATVGVKEGVSAAGAAVAPA